MGLSDVSHTDFYLVSICVGLLDTFQRAWWGQKFIFSFYMVVFPEPKSLCVVNFFVCVRDGDRFVFTKNRSRNWR